MEIRQEDFFKIHAIEGAPKLLGKLLCTNINGEVKKLRITETECYMGTDDLACHASKGKTPRNSVLYEKGGLCYVYIVYGMHNLVNVIFGEKDFPEGVLIRCCEGFEGPARLTKALRIDRSLNRESFLTSDKIWLEDDGYIPTEIITKPRVGVDYAGEYWAKIPWRFVDNTKSNAAKKAL